MMEVDNSAVRGTPTMERCNGLTLQDPRFVELDLAIARYRDRSDAVMYVLERARYLFGMLPLPVLHYVANGLGISQRDVYQAVSFYDLFATRPLGEHTVSVCLCTNCYLAGSGAIFDRLQAELGIGPGETTPDGLFALTVSYAGEGCGNEPSFAVDGQRFTAKPEEITAILKSFRPAASLVGAGTEGVN